MLIQLKTLKTLINSQVTTRIKKISRLGTLPQVTWKLMQPLNNENTTPNNLQKVVAQDLVLLTKVINLSNFIYYRLRTPTTTIARNIIITGFKELEFLTLVIGLTGTFDLRKASYNYDGDLL